ncbi:hypothetical protein [Campylobacter estrildidarum]|uniref:Uncharacterized protein n=1 Tax=Campylobacter estrildidarum TaxID=2510189 RepID=A0A4V6DXG9_9BACT|nr:hypothetical protein [Campylobacter estrildidarum]TKX31592.1 hypothetical protein CQA69_02940 [Campylobacter estrildidarum]
MNINKIQNTNILDHSKKTSNQTQSNFDDILKQSLNLSSLSQNSSYLGNVNKTEFKKAIDDILSKMDQIINSTKNKDPHLIELQNHFKAQVGIYNLVLNEAQKASENLNTSDSKELINNSKELSKDMFLQYSFGYGIAEQAKTFFAAAGVSDENIQTDIAKIAKYIDNTQHKIELDNDKVIRTMNEIIKDKNSTYISYAEFNNKNQLLESLLQISNK